MTSRARIRVWNSVPASALCGDFTFLSLCSPGFFFPFFLRHGHGLNEGVMALIRCTVGVRVLDQCKKVELCKLRPFLLFRPGRSAIADSSPAAVAVIVFLLVAAIHLQFFCNSHRIYVFSGMLNCNPNRNPNPRHRNHRAAADPPARPAADAAAAAATANESSPDPCQPPWSPTALYINYISAGKINIFMNFLSAVAHCGVG